EQALEYLADLERRGHRRRLQSVGVHAMKGSMVSRNTSAVNGLEMRNNAPACSACERIDSDPSDVTNANGVWLPSPRRLRSSSMPVISGMLQSERTKSG